MCGDQVRNAFPTGTVDDVIREFARQTVPIAEAIRVRHDAHLLSVGRHTTLED